MEDPFTPSGHGSISRQRSRPNLALPMPAPPSSRSLSDFGVRTPSPPPRPRSPEITGNALRQHLQQLLDQKAGQLQTLGTMGQEIVKQHQELDERIRAFDVGGEDEIGEETKAKLRELDDAMRNWEEENEGMLRELGAKVPDTLDLAPAPAADAAPSTLTRRQRNAQHRALGMEFASEIGQNLIQEVRRLQLLLSERDRALEKFSEEKENWIAEEKGLQDALRAERGNNDRYKEENWNLEVSLQELRSNHADVNDQLVKTTAEHARISKSLVSAREIAEMHKTDYEKQASLLAELKQKHETEMAQARRTTAGLQRDKSDLLGELNVERQRRVSGLRGRASRGATASPQVSTPHDEEDDEDVFGGANVSPRKRPGFGDDDKALSPSQLYESDFESPAGTPARGEKEYIRSPLGEVYINEAQELRDQLERANAEIATLKGDKRTRKTSEASVDEFGNRTPGWEDEHTASGRGSTRGRRGRGRGFAASLSRKLGLSRVGSGLSNSDKSFSSGSSATPDLLRTRAALAMDSPDSLSSSPRQPGAFSSDMDLAASLGNANALADELGGATVQYSDMGTMTDPVEFASSTSNSSVPALDSAPTQSSIAESSVATPTHASFAVMPSSEVTPTKKAAALPPSNLAYGFTRDISLGDVSTTETDTDDFTDARESIGTVTPSGSIPELATDAEAYETGREYQTSMAADSSASESEDEDNTRRGTVLGLANMARRMASRDRFTERIVEKIVEVPVEKIVEVEKIVHVEVPKEIFIEKIVEVQVPVDKLVEVEKIVEVEKRVEVPVEKIIEIEKIIEVPVDKIIEVEKLVEIEKLVEVPVDRIVEKTIEVPVDRIVEKIVHIDKLVEVPVEKIVEKVVKVEKIVEVEKLVDRIVEVEKVVEVPKIVEVEKVVEKIVDREVEVPKIVEVEKIVEKIVEVEKPVDRVVEVQVDRDVERIVEVEKLVEKIVEVPKIVEVERVVEKIVDRVVEVPKEVIVEKRIEVPVEIIKEVEKIVERQVEVPVEVIREVEKIVEHRIEVPVEVIREVEKIVEVDRIVEKTVEIPVDRVVEKIIEVPIDRIVEVEKRVEIEKIIEVPVDRIVEVEKRVEVEKVIEVPVEKIVEKIVHVPAEPAINDLGMFRVTSANYDFLKAPPSADALSKRASSSSLADGLPTSMDKSAPAIDGLPDKSRPPTMNLPPPPSMPPPSGTGKRMSTGPAPPRPTSPPPEDFVVRSATPSNTVNRRKSKPPTAARTSTMDPPTVASRQASRVSMKPAATPARDESYLKSRESVIAKAQQVIPAPSRSDAESLRRHASVSSIGSVVPSKEAHGSTDPATIHAITQTMIGEYLYKYTRARLGKGQSENRHKRFFWVHPYTKTLYWSSEDPGSLRASESSAKSVFISSVRAFDDPNNNPPGLYTKSIVVATPGREIQFTAPNQERHDLWMSALQFLLQQQQNGTTMTGSVRSVVKDSTIKPSASRLSLAPIPAMMNGVDDQGRLLKSPLSMRSFKSQTDVRSLSSMTPKADRAQSSVSHRTPSTMGKRTGTAAYEYIRRHDVPATLHGGHRFKGTYKGAPIADDFDVVMRDDGDDPDESFEGLENVRACCDGRHVVGSHKHHHHTYDKFAPASGGSFRATTPSLRAWSVKSRASNADAKSLGESYRGTAKGKGALRGDVPPTPTPTK